MLAYSAYGLQIALCAYMHGRLNHSPSYEVRIGSIYTINLVTLGHNLVKHPPSDKVILNFSNRVLTSTEKGVLSLGSGFCIPPKNYRLVDHYLPFKKLAFVLSKMNFYNPSIDRKSYYHSKLKSIAASSFKNIGENLNSINNLNKSQLMALKNLASDKTIVILKPDKGNGVVLMNKVDYISKVDVILHVIYMYNNTLLDN